jgi:hypothetical protein
VEEHLRPDLSRILPRPWLRQLAGRTPAFAPVLAVPEAARDDDFLVDVDRTKAPAAGEPGFDLHTAQTVAQRVEAALRRGEGARAVHCFDADRVQHLFARV